jgi:hypothetical protein
MNRLHDLRRTLPRTLSAAEASPPAEVAILDYNSSDGLESYVCQFGNAVTYTRFEGRWYYHIAHAWNLATRCSGGEYIVIAGADALFRENYLVVVRQLIDQGAVWIRGRHYKGIVCLSRHEFEEMGGYDERFEFYGSEDKELEARLVRRGAQLGLLPDDLVYTLKTPDENKVQNYRLPMTKREMMRHNATLRKESEAMGRLVANEGQQWGAWE